MFTPFFNLIFPLKQVSVYIAVVIWALSFLGSCYQVNSPQTEIYTPPMSPEAEIAANIDSIKLNSKPGDLIVRLNDDIMSEIIRQIAVNDKSFSHAGIVVIKNNKKLVCHIVPNDLFVGADTVKYEPLDSFIDPKTNLSCGWYRYNISPEETNKLIAALDNFHQKKVYFDKRFDLNTNDSLYCSEMLAKALQAATSNRLQFKEILVPKHLIKMMLFYFRKYHPTYHQIETTPFIPIESLYAIPDCKALIRTKLKILP